MHQVVIIVHPETFQFGEYCVGLKWLEIADLNIRHPEIFEDSEVESCQRLVILETRFRISSCGILEVYASMEKRLKDIFAKANETFRYQSEFNNQINLDSTQSLHNIWLPV